MANNPINLLLHFLLELVAWFALGYWGWTQQQVLTRWLLAISLPLIAIALWGTFRVPGDPREAPLRFQGSSGWRLNGSSCLAVLWPCIARIRRAGDSP
jgi:predicted small integral membrane protein